jgi:hypothetical protein
LPSQQSFPSRRASLQRVAHSCFPRAWRAPPRALRRVGRRRKSRRARRRRPGDRGKETAARALHQGERGGRDTKEKGEPGAAVDRICRGAPPYLVLDPALAPVAEEMDSSSHPTSATTDRNCGLSRRPGRSLGAAAGAVLGRGDRGGPWAQGAAARAVLGRGGRPPGRCACGSRE